MRKKVVSLILAVSVLVLCFCGTIAFAADVSMSFDSAYGMVEKMADYLCLQEAIDRDYIYDWVHSYMKTDLGVDSLITLVDDQSAVGTNETILNYINSFGTTEVEKNKLKLALLLAKSIPTASRAAAFDDMKAREEFSLPMTEAESEAVDAIYNEFISADILEMLNNSAHAINKNVIMKFLSDFNTTFVVTDGLENAENIELYKLGEEFKSKLESGELKEKFETVNEVDWQNGEELISIFVNSLNTSAKLDAQAKQDFKTVWGIPGVDMYVKRVFDVSVSGDIEQVEGATTDITFTATSNIETDDLTAVSWYVNDELKHTGSTYTYNPSDLSAGESAVVKAVIGAYEKSVTVTVSEATEATYEISITGKLSQTSDNRQSVKFVLTSSNPDEDLSDVEWYVGTKLQGVTGDTFSYRPSSVGTFKVTAKLADGTILNAGTIGVTAVAKPSYGDDSYGGGGIAEPEDELTPSEEFEKFEDMKGHWAASYMGKLYAKGIMVGTSETTMSPDWGVTRQEVALLLVRMFGFEGQKAESELDYADSDKIASWAVNAVALLSEKGIYLGYGDGTFRPDDIISRQELASVVGRHLTSTVTKESDYIDDHEIYYWAKEHIDELTSLGILRGFEDNSFRPLEKVTRAQAAVVIYNTMVSIGAY